MLPGQRVFLCKVNFNVQNRDRVRACVRECVRACLSLASDSSETVEVTIVKLGTVTASDMRMHHVLIILTLIFSYGHTDLNHENNKCSIISGIIHAMPIRFAVKIV